MNRNYIGAIDQGTSGTRFMVFDSAGHVVATAYEPQEKIYPLTGWVEQDPLDIWETVKRVVSRGLSSGSLDPSDLAGIGITNQRESTVVWERESGEPVYNAIVWQDSRTTDRVEELKEDDKVEWIRDRTGLECDAYFSATKLEWILDNIEVGDRTSPDLRDRASDGDLLFGTIDSWLVYNLTGVHSTDVTNASRTMLYDIHDCRWDEDLLAEFSIPKEMLPTVYPSSDPDGFGRTDPDGFLEAEVPVTGVIGDQQAALFGQTCFDEGDAKNTYGIGSFYLMNTGTEAVESDNGLLTTIGYQLSGEPVQYALEGAVFITGGAVEWITDVGFVDNFASTASLAKAVDSARGVYFVPAFDGLGSPYWDYSARGSFFGLSRDVRREHIVRATLESIAYQTRDVLEAMEADFGRETETLRVDGGAVKNDFLCQLQSDILQRNVVRPVVDETTALGAAYTAGLAVGYWDSLDQLRSNWQADRKFEPEMAPGTADSMYERWTEAVERAQGWERDS